MLAIIVILLLNSSLFLKPAAIVDSIAMCEFYAHTWLAVLSVPFFFVLFKKGNKIQFQTHFDWFHLYFFSF